MRHVTRRTVEHMAFRQASRKTLSPTPSFESQVSQVEAAQGPTEPFLFRRALVCHSDEERCGVREYGLGLDRSLAPLFGPEEEHRAFTFAELPDRMGEIRSGDVLLVHFEPGLVPRHLSVLLRQARARGAKVVFVCHWFGDAVPREYGPDLVDRFVLHKLYDALTVRDVLLPLACPVFEPPDRASVRDRLGVARDAFLVAFTGFLVDTKCIPEVVDALLGASRGVEILIQTPWPFRTGTAGSEEKKLREVIARHPFQKVHFSTEFLPEEEVLARVSAADLGVAFHAKHTGSASATSKQFIAARCPLALSASDHMVDVREGALRIATLNPYTFGRSVARALLDRPKLKELAEGVRREYARLNMDAVAGEYVALFRSLSER